MMWVIERTLRTLKITITKHKNISIDCVSTGALLPCNVLSDWSLSGIATSSDSVSSSKLESWYFRNCGYPGFWLNVVCLFFVAPWDPWLVPSANKGLAGGLLRSYRSSCSAPSDGWLQSVGYLSIAVTLNTEIFFLCRSLPRLLLGGKKSITMVAGIRLQWWKWASNEFKIIRTKFAILPLYGGWPYWY